MFSTGIRAAGGIALAHDEKPSAVPKIAGNPLIYQFKIGNINAWSISDGHSLMGKGNPLGMMWPEQDRPVMKTWMEERNEGLDGIPLYINILVIRRGTEVILFDAGFLSHAHGDHLEGFVRDGKPAFPNAAFHFLTDEYDFWYGPNPDFSKSRRNKQQLPGMVKNVLADFESLKGVAQPLKPGTELFGGMVTVEAAPGHTAGHAIFRIQSGSESLLHIVDLAHHHGLNFHNPDWTIEFDHDPVLAVETRKKVFAKAAAERTRCYGFHLPWPGLGQILPVGGGYLWHPERWSWGS